MMANVSLEFMQPHPDHSACVGLLSLSRPAQANAFNGAMIAEITASLQQVTATPHCRLLLIYGQGKHFSAGADLGWMQEAATLSYQENLAEAARLGAMFAALAQLPMPTIAAVRGAAFGGAVGLIACCDFAIAAASSRFCLSEVSLGLLPAVILPHLQRKIAAGALKSLSLRSKVFMAEEAKAVGLVEEVAADSSWTEHVSTAVREILAGGAQAQRAFKELSFALTSAPAASHGALTAAAIAQARTGSEGQEGLHSFLSKSPPNWRVTLPTTWTLEL